MPAAISIAIEGPDANRALDDFLAIAGIVGEALPVERGRVMRDGGVLVAIGAIGGFAGRLASIVSDIRRMARPVEGGAGEPAPERRDRGREGEPHLARPRHVEQITSALQSLQP